jgi:hypothetical protein
LIVVFSLKTVLLLTSFPYSALESILLLASTFPTPEKGVQQLPTTTLNHQHFETSEISSSTIEHSTGHLDTVKASHFE